MITNSNKYGSIIETFTGGFQINDLLSAYATPPANLTLTAADLLTVYGNQIYPSGIATPLVRFAANDQMRCLGYGIFCNIADGLVLNIADDTDGLALSLYWSAFTGAAQVQANFAPSPFGGAAYFPRVNALNVIHECDWRWDFSAIPAAADNIRGVANISIPNSVTFSTITVDPAFAAAQILMWPVFVIEHSRPMLPTGYP